MVETIPGLHQKNEDMWDSMEFVCIMVFTAEFVLRVLSNPNMCDFVKGPLNWVDFIAIAPWYMELIAKMMDDGGGGSGGLTVLRVVRLVRVFRVVRVGRHVFVGFCPSSALAIYYTLFFSCSLLRSVTHHPRLVPLFPPRCTGI